MYYLSHKSVNFKSNFTIYGPVENLFHQESELTFLEGDCT